MKKEKFQMLTPENRVAFVKAVLNTHKGKFFSATWTKKDGSLRRASGKAKHKASVTGAGLKFDASSKGLVPYWDANKRAWRMLDTSTLENLKAGGKVYVE